VAKGAVATEEQVISQAQYLDLVYTKSSTLYENIQELPRSTPNNPPLLGSHATDGMIGSMS